MRTRLYLVTPRQIDLATFPAALRAALSGGDVASVLIAPEVSAEAHLQRIAEALVPMIQEASAAALVLDDTRAMGRSKADGIHVTGGAAAVRDTVERMAGRAIVGAGGLKNRHEAMEVAEAGADYVFFGLLDRPDDDDAHRKTLDLGSWWAEVFEPPCVLLAGRSLESVEDCARIGADFVAVRDGVWSHPDGPTTAVTAINAILDRVDAHGEGEA